MKTTQHSQWDTLKGTRIGLLGCGDIGTRLGRQLVDAGALPIGFRRHAQENEPFPVINLDFQKPETLSALQEPFDYLVVTLVPDRRFDEQVKAYEKGYVENLTHILQAIDTDSLKRLFWVSSTSVYGQTDGEWVDEDSPANATSPTAQVLLAAENLLAVLKDKATVVRFSGIYRDKSHRYLDKLLKGELPAKANKDSLTNRIHITDAVSVLGYFMNLDAQGKSLEKLYIGTDCEPVDYASLVSFLSEALAKPLNHTLIQTMPASSKRLSNKRLLSTGFSFEYRSYKDGFHQLITGYKHKED